MKLCNIISENCFGYYRNKISTWIKPGDQVRDLMNGKIYMVENLDNIMNGFVSKVDDTWRPVEFYEKVGN